MNDKFEHILKPAVNYCKASGREQKPCEYCEKKLVKEEDIVELYSGSFRNHTNYSHRFHRRCFLKIILIKFPEILDSQLKDEIVKEMVVFNLK